ncbi:UPF0182 protein [Syntrophobotulus glycolicus DSM 8271]|uniref:UPF0182 protein Sgly_1788 n=1 Tax=Syntrophobotulus glycolicus (strain DSM 8271 / FlGlyR) TaxID=645991 RepID=F0SZJ9_SYNGF|nr:UPF0182 family protein [Syntrophobotulus glycolicus]ADY56085.1 UPF0182 protein [Syntrophobotulus glycolicus DSM 8271]
MKVVLRIFILLALFLGILKAASGFYEDWLWFSDLGYADLFWTPVLSKAVIQIINGTILFILLSITLLSSRHAILTYYNENLRKRLRLVEDMGTPSFYLNSKQITVFLLVLAAIISFIISFIVGFTGWLDVLAFINSSDFYLTDPIFGKDFSFFVFRLPFLVTIYNAFFPPLVLLTIATASFYFLTKVFRIHSFKFWKRNSVSVNPTARKHMAILLTVLFTLKAFGYYISIYSLVYSQEGHVIGAGYTDIHVTVPVLKILIGICLLCSLLSVLAYFLKDARFLSVPVPLVVVLSLVLYGILPSAFQSFLVVPNELEKEAPYLANEIQMTRYGYGLDKIEERDYAGNAEVTADGLKGEAETLANIRINDTRPLLKAYTQEQGIRLYYKYNDIDVDRYKINGQNRQIMLSLREISTADLDEKAQTFVNTRFKYTHGFGLTASFANEVTSKGLPAFAVQNIPPQTDFTPLSLEEPRIYYGELTNNWVVVNTLVKEFDYPQGSENAENNYAGRTGITFTPFNKLMLSLSQTTARFYLAQEITSQSRILLHRNIVERVNKLMPFIKYDGDPYAVIDNGRIKWFIDGYTTARTIPYSTSSSDQNINYIRNSVKVIVDAYDGTVDFYSVDQEDPVLATYKKIFPGVFKDLADMPSSLKAHLRYPETMFKMQCQMLNHFHMTNPRVFYNKEDAWDLAKEVSNTQTESVDPYYVIMKLPDESKAEFILMQPFTPASSETNVRNNMISWLAARSDGDYYGKLVLYKLPKTIQIDGPFQVESRIDQDPEISKQLALWNQKGSSVIRGNLLALPFAGNFLFIEPVYLQSNTSGSIPEMKRIVAVLGDKVVMEETLDKAIQGVLGETEPVTTVEPKNESVPETTSPSQDLDTIKQQLDQIRTILDQLEKQLDTANQTE